MCTYLLSCAGEVIKEWSGDMNTEVRPQNKTMWREDSKISLICSKKMRRNSQKYNIAEGRVLTVREDGMFYQNRVSVVQL